MFNVIILDKYCNNLSQSLIIDEKLEIIVNPIPELKCLKWIETNGPHLKNWIVDSATIFIQTNVIVLLFIPHDTFRYILPFLHAFIDVSKQDDTPLVILDQVLCVFQYDVLDYLRVVLLALLDDFDHQAEHIFGVGVVN